MPTSLYVSPPGLDARAAAIVMRAVRNTVDTGRTVVCTIHQPSIDIFEVSMPIVCDIRIRVQFRNPVLNDVAVWVAGLLGGWWLLCTVKGLMPCGTMQSFDELLLMKRGGRIIFHGPLGHQSCKLIEYFQVHTYLYHG